MSISREPLSVISTATMSPTISQLPTLDLPPMLTALVTPFPTRKKEEVSKDLAYMLKTNGDCKFPCFWGIYPDLTKYNELYSVIDHLGGSRFETLGTNGHINVYSSFRSKDDDGVQTEFAADLQNDIVKNMKISLLNLYSAGVTLEDWSAYNLDEIQDAYGPPDSVELGLAQISDAISFTVILRYESINTVILYNAGIPEGQQSSTSDSVLFCPKEVVFDAVTLYMGDYPFNTIPSGTPLLKATGLTEQNFYELFTENPYACLNLNRKAFYP